MIELDGIIVAGFSGLFGVIIGTLLSSFINYKLNLRFLQKKLIFNENASNYEKIRKFIHSLNEVYGGMPFKIVDVSEGMREAFLKESLHTMSWHIENFHHRYPLKEEYIPYEIRRLLKDYELKIEEFNKKPPKGLKEIEKMWMNFNWFTNVINEKIDIEMGLI